MVIKKIYFLFLFTSILSCKRSSEATRPDTSKEDGAQLAARYCTSCHAFVPPEKLTKSSWKEDVLPTMGNRMGIYKNNKRPEDLFEPGEGGQVVKAANIFPSTPSISNEEWERIVDYYISRAPASIPASRSASIPVGLANFEYKPYRLPSPMPLTSFVTILPETSQIAFGTTYGRSYTLNILNADLKNVQSYKMTALPIQFTKLNDESYSLTTIGKGSFPTDARDGWVSHLHLRDLNNLSTETNFVLDKLKRPVNIVYKDLNGDGLDDIVACEFGSYTGTLGWYENKKDKYEFHPLVGKPGATKVVIDDVDADGKPDILALMAQADEGIFYLHNNGKGFDPARSILSFSPLYGSTFFDYIDFNNDGVKDIIYTCGDNADYTPFLKEYHGIYIFLGQPDFTFKQHFFHQLNGAYKAIARDYDQDGDLDIAAISYFPDYANAQEEGFVYLQNQGNMRFNASTFAAVGIGRWIAMDANDYDKDGDVDIVIGSNVSILPMGDVTGINKRWLKEAVSLVVLENKVKQKR
ncbi:VCBS repeat-containing protein [Chryseolinea sp. T2]|uniref:FG-GAP repeat domain-containing protein n=1 Tax=Chryseolinea sp. T2 TaxID=3129255 RepID=UPI003077F296